MNLAHADQKHLLPDRRPSRHLNGENDEALLRPADCTPSSLMI